VHDQTETRRVCVGRYDEELAQSDVLVQDARGRLAAANTSLLGAAQGSSRPSRPAHDSTGAAAGARKPISTSWK